MSWKFGAIFIDKSVEEGEQEFVRSLFGAVESTSEQISASDAFRSSFENIAIGYWNGKTIIANNILAYESISELPFLEKNKALQFIEEYSKQADILTTYAYSSADIMGDCLYREGRKAACHFQQGKDLSMEVNKELMPSWYPDKNEYNEEVFSEIINGFLGELFDKWLANNRIIMQVYED